MYIHLFCIYTVYTVYIRIPFQRYMYFRNYTEERRVQIRTRVSHLLPGGRVGRHRQRCIEGKKAPHLEPGSHTSGAVKSSAFGHSICYFGLVDAEAWAADA
jgi:hypothetical protein